MAISAFAMASTALRTMINRFIIRFSRLILEEVTVACSYIACHNGSLTLLDVEYLPSTRALNTAPPVCSARTLIRSSPDSAGVRSKGDTLYSANTKIIQMHA
uniref:Uncharacterized protein n=2 Tax=Enterobacteriaceae TaxID=543 RepID=A0A0E3NAL7_ECOLX|nr:hypothetical protein pOU1114_047 [Salmonella enterica subsp. enterica serovar Dublin]AKB09777.1 hypothetical protein [Escherichia coli]